MIQATSAPQPSAIVVLANLTEEQRDFFLERMHWWKGTPIGQHLDRVAKDFNLINSKKGLELDGDQVRILLSQAREAARNESANAVHEKGPELNVRRNGENNKPRCKRRSSRPLQSRR